MIGCTNCEDETSSKLETVTLQEFLEEQRKLEMEAAEALPYKFDQCTWEFGPLRQNLHICHDCPNDVKGSTPLAFCYSCAVTCHNFSPEQQGYSCEKSTHVHNESQDDSDLLSCYDNDSTSQSNEHRVEEIWARRNFRCDCPSTGKCQLVSPAEYANDNEASFAEHSNSYHQAHNFQGQYCFCRGKGWDEGDRTMYQCEVCEDWFHDDCVAKARQRIQKHQLNETNASSTEVVPEDSFKDFICCQCVQDHFEFFRQLAFSNSIFTHPRGKPLAIGSSLFLASDWRLNLSKQAGKKPSLTALAEKHKLMHLLAPEQPVYCPELDSEAKESLYELGLKALEKNASREQAILGIQMIDGLKDRLKGFFDSISKAGRKVITSGDIQGFFAEEAETRKKRAKL